MLRSLQGYVARRAERRPEAPALAFEDEAVSYGELEARSNRLARLLMKGGCSPGERIGLLLPKSAAAVAAMLGALKAGCIYVPIDPESPAARVERILRAADCRFLIVAPSTMPLARRLVAGLEREARPDVVLLMEGGSVAPDGGVGVRFTESDAEAFSAEPLSHDPGPDMPAHILFTSGSTGAPKGVVVTHANVIAFVTWANAYFRLGEDERLSCHSPLHFDLSTYDLFGGFAAGAEVHPVPPALNLFPGRLVDFIRGHRLTQWFSVPSILAYLARFDAVKPDDFPELRRLIWCGEVFPTSALSYWMRRLPRVSFTNLYGPTETTIASSYHTLSVPPSEPGARVPIGEACGGEEILVLGADLEPRPAGEVGGIHIRGAGVTRGYWRDEERTREAFLDAPGGRMYRTGDLGYRGEDGLVYFLGRADSQIKSRGHRIELGEIEAALHAVPEVGDGAIVAVPAADFGGHVICCAYVLQAGSGLAPAALKDRLATLLPRYMLPARWRRLERLPSNANGKVDRVALADLFRGEGAGGEGAAAGIREVARPGGPAIKRTGRMDA
jgi:amino acid adenylation domain-containing protein